MVATENGVPVDVTRIGTADEFGIDTNKEFISIHYTKKSRPKRRLVLIYHLRLSSSKVASDFIKWNWAKFRIIDKTI